MNPFSFFRKTEKKGADSTVDSDQIIQSKTEEKNTDEVETTLSYHPDWEVAQEQEYVFRFLSNELEPLKPNQLSLSGIDIDVDATNGSWLVKAFFRSSLPDEITVGEVGLFLLDKDGNIQAEKEFDFNELGNIPPKSDRPWVFVFEKNTQLTEVPPAEGWKLAFNIQSLVPHSLDLEPSWEEALSEEQKEGLRQLVDSLPKLDKDEVNFTGFQARFNSNDGFDVSLFVRNGHSKEINLEKIPLEIIDAAGQTVCSGSFDLPPLSVKGNTSKPWTFTFPKELIQVDNPDLSRWTARVLQS